MSDNNQSNDDWDSYRALVVDNFKRINKRLEEIETKFDELKDNHFHHLQIEMQSLKVQINMYGKFGIGLIAVPGIFLAIIQIIKLVAK
jgi:hypothetical protein